MVNETCGGGGGLSKVPGLERDKEVYISFNSIPKLKGVAKSGVHILPPVSSHSTLPPTPFTVLEKESKFNFGMYPKGVPIPPSGPSGRTSTGKYTPPPPPYTPSERPRFPWDVPCHHPNPPCYCVLLRPPPHPLTLELRSSLMLLRLQVLRIK
ncbi:unnamed protein product [Citrullus colocynthis]|uniref:Uncharacterized protein n=1 Tax=Citrullus colocynthis TaxID=252529 RepID=A0ABP0YGW8_9ROSI